jgi:hypothetical protein
MRRSIWKNGGEEYFAYAREKREERVKTTLPLWRKLLGAFFGAVALGCMVWVLRIGDYESMFRLENVWSICSAYPVHAGTGPDRIKEKRA